MPEIRGTFSYDEGDLTPGRSRNGGFSQLLYDRDGSLVAHATFHPDDEDDERRESRFEPATEATSPEDEELDLGVVIALALVVAGVVAAPRVKQWWINTAAPQLSTVWSKFRSRLGRKKTATTDHEAGTELAALSQTATVDFFRAVDEVLSDTKSTMNGDEAYRRLAMMLMAAAFISEQLDRLSNVRIEDDPDLHLLLGAVDKLTAGQVIDEVNTALELNSALLSDDASLEFMRRFGGGRFVDGNYVPVRAATIADALRLPRTDLPSLQPRAIGANRSSDTTPRTPRTETGPGPAAGRANP